MFPTAPEEVLTGTFRTTRPRFEPLHFGGSLLLLALRDERRSLLSVAHPTGTSWLPYFTELSRQFEFRHRELAMSIDDRPALSNGKMRRKARTRSQSKFEECGLQLRTCHRAASGMWAVGDLHNLRRLSCEQQLKVFLLICTEI